MVDLPTFREWLRGNKPTVPLLVNYLSALGHEWLRSEDKLATNDIDSGVRRAVVALHNTRGGQVFLGVNQDRQPEGTNVKVERLRQVLSQRDVPPPNDACLTDLNLAVALPLVVDDGGQRVVVIETHRTGKAALFLDNESRFQLLYRRGDETLEADAGGTIHWYRQSRREEMLVGLYRELKAFTRRIRTWAPFPEIPDPVLPYLASCMANGSLYAFLSEDDLISLIGGSKDANSGSGGGFVGTYLATVRQARVVFREEGCEATQPTLGNVLQSRRTGTNLSANLQEEMDRQVTDFRNWLLHQGILPD
jgi:hypothetical protein